MDKIPTEKDARPILTALRHGTFMLHYTEKGKSERKTFQLNSQEFKVSWFPSVTSGRMVEEGSIPIESIKEVNTEPPSARVASIIRKLDNSLYCIFILYGYDFRLQMLICLAQNAVERDYWVKGIAYLKHKNQYVSPIDLTQQWLCRQWACSPKNKQNRTSIRVYSKFFLQTANTKVNSEKISEILPTVVDGSTSIERIQGYDIINYSAFCGGYLKLLNIPDIIIRHEEFFEDNGEDLIMGPVYFQRFLLEEQNDVKAKDMEYVYKLMRYVKCRDDDDDGDVLQIRFNTSDFLQYLFGGMNSIFKEEHCTVYQDMTKPLSWYWIASSHNTYLEGDQIQSEVTEEAYARVLKMGSRCIELDCWDGPNNEPSICHAYKNISFKRIKLEDVLRVIARNAFITSEYPLILSIENHCSVTQQIVMANLFKKYLGKYLVTERLRRNENQLPSPEALKHRIIIKHGKLESLDDSGDETKPLSRISFGIDEGIVSTAKKFGIMDVKDEYDDWVKYLMVINENLLFYSLCKDKVEVIRNGDKNEGINDLNFSEEWFHKSIDRTTAEELLLSSQKGDGTFLVRTSATFVGGYTLSFLLKGKVKHAPVKCVELEDGSKNYHVMVGKNFETLSSLIDYYHHHQMKSKKFELKLQQAVRESDMHIDKDWYHDSLTRFEAEYMLKRLRKNGYFLVRKCIPDSNSEPESYAISFRTSGRIKHCRIEKEDHLFMIGCVPFKSLTELVEYYHKYPLYRKTRLRYPCNDEVVQQSGQNPQDEDEDDDIYAMPNMLSALKPACRAMFDYQQLNEGELSFNKGALILNVTKEDGGWWKGDYNGQEQKWFPSNYTMEMAVQQAEIDQPGHRDSEGIVNLLGCQCEIQSCDSSGYLFRLGTCGDGVFECSVESEAEMNEWVRYLKDASSKHEEENISEPVQILGCKFAKELSDLVYYCTSRKFTSETFETGKYNEMSSFTELDMEKYVTPLSHELLMYKYHERQISRVYPKGLRITSSNYDPVQFWNFGVQMCALNYQTCDRGMQIERGSFLDNGGCGYVLQPDVFRNAQFNPFYPSTFENVKPLYIRVSILAARHLLSDRNILMSPFVEVEVIGLPCDTRYFRTQITNENGLCPTWSHTPFDFDVKCPPLAKISFVVKHEDIFNDQCFIAQACFPVTSLRGGHRSVQLRTGLSEEIPLASLLVEIHVKDSYEDEEFVNIAALHEKTESMKNSARPESMALRAIQKELSQLDNQQGSKYDTLSQRRGNVTSRESNIENIFL